LSVTSGMVLDVSVGTDVEVDGGDTVRVGAAVAGNAEVGVLTGLGVQPEITALNMVAKINRTAIWLWVFKFMIPLPDINFCLVVKLTDLCAFALNLLFF